MVMWMLVIRCRPFLLKTVDSDTVLRREVFTGVSNSRSKSLLVPIVEDPGQANINDKLL
jgi:hypothetical protein